MIEAGRRAFASHRDDPEIMGFWWPRFMRIAEWFAQEDEKLRSGVATSLTEKRGAVAFSIGDTAFSLSARADRIDIFERGTARIIDYKTGQPPGRHGGRDRIQAATDARSCDPRPRRFRTDAGNRDG